MFGFCIGSILLKLVDMGNEVHAFDLELVNSCLVLLQTIVKMLVVRAQLQVVVVLVVGVTTQLLDFDDELLIEIFEYLLLTVQVLVFITQDLVVLCLQAIHLVLCLERGEQCTDGGLDDTRCRTLGSWAIMGLCTIITRKIVDGTFDGSNEKRTVRVGKTIDFLASKVLLLRKVHGCGHVILPTRSRNGTIVVVGMIKKVSRTKEKHDMITCLLSLAIDATWK